MLQDFYFIFHDFYGEKSKADYPVSVKSGGGGKVSIGNILDALADKVKEGKVNPAEQKSYKVFQTQCRTCI